MTSPSDLKQAIVSDITSGLSNIPIDSIADSTAVSDNIVFTLRNAGTLAQANAIQKLPPKKSLQLLQTSVGTALGLYVILHSDAIDNQNTFLTAVANSVMNQMLNPPQTTPVTTKPDVTTPVVTATIKNNKVVTHTQTRIPKLYIGLWVVQCICM